MAVAGIKTETDKSGHLTSITIDVQQHKEVLPLLQEMGLLEMTPFEKECAEAITVEEAREHTHQFIRNLPWKA
jgi:hypothetical protein